MWQLGLVQTISRNAILPSCRHGRAIMGRHNGMPEGDEVTVPVNERGGAPCG